MKIFDTGGYHRYASLISGSDHLLKYVTYVT